MPFVTDQQAEVSAPRQKRDDIREDRIYEAFLDIIARLDRIEAALKKKGR